MPASLPARAISNGLPSRPSRPPRRPAKLCTLSLGGDVWGHDLTRLIELLPPSHRAPADLVDRGKALDKHYLPARYPNGFAAGTPREHYTGREAEQAIADADAIIEFCARSIPR